MVDKNVAKILRQRVQSAAKVIAASGALFPMLRVSVRHPQYGWQIVSASNSAAVILNDFTYYHNLFEGEVDMTVTRISGDQIWSVLLSYDVDGVRA